MECDSDDSSNNSISMQERGHIEKQVDCSISKVSKKRKRNYNLDYYDIVLDNQEPNLPLHSHNIANSDKEEVDTTTKSDISSEEENYLWLQTLTQSAQAVLGMRMQIFRSWLATALKPEHTADQVGGLDSRTRMLFAGLNSVVTDFGRIIKHWAKKIIHKSVKRFDKKFSDKGNSFLIDGTKNEQGRMYLEDLLQCLRDDVPVFYNNSDDCKYYRVLQKFQKLFNKYTQQTNNIKNEISLLLIVLCLVDASGDGVNIILSVLIDRMSILLDELDTDIPVNQSEESEQIKERIQKYLIIFIQFIECCDCYFMELLIAVRIQLHSWYLLSNQLQCICGLLIRLRSAFRTYLNLTRHIAEVESNSYKYNSGTNSLSPNTIRMRLFCYSYAHLLSGLSYCLLSTASTAMASMTITPSRFTAYPSSSSSSSSHSRHSKQAWTGWGEELLESLRKVYCLYNRDDSTTVASTDDDDSESESDGRTSSVDHDDDNDGDRYDDGESERSVDQEGSSDSESDCSEAMSADSGEDGISSSVDGDDDNGDASDSSDSTEEGEAATADSGEEDSSSTDDDHDDNGDASDSSDSTEEGEAATVDSGEEDSSSTDDDHEDNGDASDSSDGTEEGEAATADSGEEDSSSTDVDHEDNGDASDSSDSTEEGEAATVDSDEDDCSTISVDGDINDESDSMSYDNENESEVTAVDNNDEEDCISSVMDEDGGDNRNNDDDSTEEDEVGSASSDTVDSLSSAMSDDDENESTNESENDNESTNESKSENENESENESTNESKSASESTNESTSENESERDGDDNSEGFEAVAEAGDDSSASNYGDTNSNADTADDDKNADDEDASDSDCDCDSSDDDVKASEEGDRRDSNNSDSSASSISATNQINTENEEEEEEQEEEQEDDEDEDEEEEEGHKDDKSVDMQQTEAAHEVEQMRAEEEVGVDDNWDSIPLWEVGLHPLLSLVLYCSYFPSMGLAEIDIQTRITLANESKNYLQKIFISAQQRKQQQQQLQTNSAILSEAEDNQLRSNKQIKTYYYNDNYNNNNNINRLTETNTAENAQLFERVSVFDRFDKHFSNEEQIGILKLCEILNLSTNRKRNLNSNWQLNLFRIPFTAAAISSISSSNTNENANYSENESENESESESESDYNNNLRNRKLATQLSSLDQLDYRSWFQLVNSFVKLFESQQIQIQQKLKLTTKIKKEYTNNICYLPNELLRVIYSYLSYSRVLALATLCKSLQSIVKDEMLWNYFYRRKYENNINSNNNFDVFESSYRNSNSCNKKNNNSDKKCKDCYNSNQKANYCLATNSSGSRVKPLTCWKNEFNCIHNWKYLFVQRYISTNIMWKIKAKKGISLDRRVYNNKLTLIENWIYSASATAATTCAATTACATAIASTACATTTACGTACATAIASTTACAATTACATATTAIAATSGVLSSDDNGIIQLLESREGAREGRIIGRTWLIKHQQQQQQQIKPLQCGDRRNDSQRLEQHQLQLQQYPFASTQSFDAHSRSVFVSAASKHFNSNNNRHSNSSTSNSNNFVITKCSRVVTLPFMCPAIGCCFICLTVLMADKHLQQHTNVLFK